MVIHEISFHFYRNLQDLFLFLWLSIRVLFFYLYGDPWDLISFLYRVNEIYFYFYVCPQDLLLFLGGDYKFHFYFYGDFTRFIFILLYSINLEGYYNAK